MDLELPTEDALFKHTSDMFQSIFHNVVTTPIPNDINAEALVQLLHNHSFLITMSPIVTRHSEAGRDPRTRAVDYDVWENIAILPFGLWMYELQFSASFADKANGVISWIQAPLGFHSEANYTVRTARAGETETERLVLEESIQTTCPILFKPFVEWTMVPVRQKMHAKMIEKSRDVGSTATDALMH